MSPHKRLALLVLVALSSFVPPAIADDAAVEGRWRLVVLAFGEDEFVVFEVKDADGKPSGNVVAAQTFMGSTSIGRVEKKGDQLAIDFVSAGKENPFSGRLAKDGDEPRPYLGTFRFRDSIYPARIEQTTTDKVGPLNRGPLPQQVAATARERDAKVRVETLAKILADNPNTPFLNTAYTAIFQAAADAELTPEQVQDHLRNMLITAEPYGAEWITQTRMTALRALSGKQPYSELTLTLAAEADKALGTTASTEDQAAVTRLYADTAKLAGKADLAASLEAKSAKLEAKLDEEYHEKVPPFKPTSYAGRKANTDDRVVVMELFTGAQCPPCVAADVGFDGLLKTYQPTELIALQYHLHIPGPDPLTNPASLGRAKYYGVRSTPSTYFNGAAAAPGGGGMAQSQAKYDQFRNIIDEGLYGNKLATIDLSVKRADDTFQIAAKATADPADLAKKVQKAAEKTDAKTDNDDAKQEKSDPDAKKQDNEPKLKLYLAVTESSIRYVGGNRLRFHHHVVRTFVGGHEGTPVTDGVAQTKVSLGINDVRDELAGYLATYQRTGSFPNPLPPIDLKDLSLVAFVQDDVSKQILHATVVRLPGE